MAGRPRVIPLASTLLAPVVMVPALVHPDWSKIRFYIPTLIAAGITAVHGWSFEGGFAFFALLAVVVHKGSAGRKLYLVSLAALSLMIFADFESARPRGYIFKNALVAGQAMTLYAVALGWPWLGFAAGFTGSRSTLLIAGVALRRSWRYFFTLVSVGIGFFAWYALHSVFSGDYDVASSNAIADRAAIDFAIESRHKLNMSWWQGWFGTGYGNFDGQRPHNGVLGLWAQAGILTIPLLAVPVWQARRFPVHVLAPVVMALVFADWLFSTAAGVLTLGIYFTVNANRSPNSQRP